MSPAGPVATVRIMLLIPGVLFVRLVHRSSSKFCSFSRVCAILQFIAPLASLHCPGVILPLHLGKLAERAGHGVRHTADRTAKSDSVVCGSLMTHPAIMRPPRRPLARPRSCPKFDSSPGCRRGSHAIPRARWPSASREPPHCVSRPSGVRGREAPGSAPITLGTEYNQQNP